MKDTIQACRSAGSSFQNSKHGSTLKNTKSAMSRMHGIQTAAERRTDQVLPKSVMQSLCAVPRVAAVKNRDLALLRNRCSRESVGTGECGAEKITAEACVDCQITLVNVLKVAGRPTSAAE